MGQFSRSNSDRILTAKKPNCAGFSSARRVAPQLEAHAVSTPRPNPPMSGFLAKLAEADAAIGAANILSPPDAK
jgi:hypothetical protein